MEKLPCPSCGGALTFRSTTSLFTVCPYCRSNVIRKDLDLEKIGEMADLPEDLSPIQIGTQGRYGKKKFIVVGRIIYGYKDGLWNEWYILFNDGSDGWLAEAQGEFAISFPIKLNEKPSLSSLKLGSRLDVDGSNFKVTDIKSIRYIGSEGELPFKAEANYRSEVFDFSNIKDLFLSIEFPLDTSEHHFSYLGRYVELPKLKLINMRMLEGWV